MKIAIFVLSLIIWIGLAVFSGLMYHANTADEKVTYSGTEVFQSEEQYQEFKLYLANHASLIKDIGVLSSEPPIIVQYEVGGTANDGFAYGKITNRRPTRWLMGFIFSSILGSIVPFLTFHLGWGWGKG